MATNERTKSPFYRLKVGGLAPKSWKFNKAKVAVARKLAVILFVMWRDGKDFAYGDKAKPLAVA